MGEDRRLTTVSSLLTTCATAKKSLCEVELSLLHSTDSPGRGRKTPDCENVLTPDIFMFCQADSSQPEQDLDIIHACDTVSSKNTPAEDQRSWEEMGDFRNVALLENYTDDTFKCRESECKSFVEQLVKQNVIAWRTDAEFPAEIICAQLQQMHHIFWGVKPFPPTWHKHCIMRWVFWGPHFSWASLQVENLIFLGDGNLFYSGIRDVLLCICACTNVLCGRMCLSVYLLWMCA